MTDAGTSALRRVTAPGVVAEVLLRQLGDFALAQRQPRWCRASVADRRQAERGVVVPQVLGQALGADQVDDPRRHPGHRRAGPLDRLGDPAGFPPVGERPEVGDVMLHQVMDLADLGAQVGVVLEIADLTLEGLLDVILERRSCR